MEEHTVLGGRQWERVSGFTQQWFHESESSNVGLRETWWLILAVLNRSPGSQERGGGCRLGSH